MDKKRNPIGQRLRAALREVAPTLAGALGGPLAGAATDAITDAVFGETEGEADLSRLEPAILARDPAALAALRQAELSFRQAVLAAEGHALEVAAGDRADARARQVSLGDVTPAVLGVAVITGFFFVLSTMLFRELPTRAETEFSIMLGALATMTAAVVNYFFGSSASSREKTFLMNGRRAPSSETP